MLASGRGRGEIFKTMWPFVGLSLIILEQAPTGNLGEQHTLGLMGEKENRNVILELCRKGWEDWEASMGRVNIFEIHL